MFSQFIEKFGIYKHVNLLYHVEHEKRYFLANSKIKSFYILLCNG